MIKELIKDSDILTESYIWNVRENQDLMIPLIQDLEETLKEHPERLFLCTNEIGYKERGILVRFADDTHEFLNPAFQKKDVPIINREKDIFTGEEYLIPRFTNVEIVYQDCLGAVKANKLNEAASVIMCQAMDLLNGLTAKDYGLPILEGFDDLSADDKAEIIADYVKSLGEKYSLLDNDLSSNEETKDIWDAAKYIKGVSDGTINTEKGLLSNRKKKKLKKMIDQVKHQSNRLKF